MLPRPSAPLALLALAACNPAPAPVIPIVAVPATTAAPTVAAEPPRAPTATPAKEEPEDGVKRRRVEIELKPGTPPCTLAIDSGMFSDDKDTFMVSGVVRMATLAGGSCAAGELYDLAKQKKARPEDIDPEALQAGVFLKPGHAPPPDFEAPDWNKLTDLDFDGWADLCVVVMTGAYNYSQMCWLFDPAKRTFVRNTDLDELIFMRLDPTAKTISNGFRAGGPVYVSNSYAWDKGKLKKTLEVVTTLGQRPDGKALPAGFTRWEKRAELRRGKMVVVKDGPEKDKP